MGKGCVNYNIVYMLCSYSQLAILRIQGMRDYASFTFFKGNTFFLLDGSLKNKNKTILTKFNIKLVA